MTSRTAYKPPKITKKQAKEFFVKISGVKNPEIRELHNPGSWSAQAGDMRYDIWIIPERRQHIYCQIVHCNLCIYAAFYHLDTLEPDHRLTDEENRRTN